MDICKDNKIFPLTSDDTWEDEAQRLKEVGGDPDTGIIQVSSLRSILSQFPARDFPDDFTYRKKTRNKMGYKFALSLDCKLNVCRYKYKHRRIDPAKDINHHLVAKGDAVYSAGAIFFFHDGRNVEKVVISNRSSCFCPSFASLELVVKHLAWLGVDADKIILVENDRCKKNRG